MEKGRAKLIWASDVNLDKWFCGSGGQDAEDDLMAANRKPRGLRGAMWLAGGLFHS